MRTGPHATRAVDDVERAVQRDLDPQRFVLDDAVLRRRHTSTLDAARRRRPNAAQRTRVGRPSSDTTASRSHGTALQTIGALPLHPAVSQDARRAPRRRRGRAQSAGPCQRRARHRSSSRRSNRAGGSGAACARATAPLLRAATRQCVEGLAPFQQEPFACPVLLFDPHARGVHGAEDRPERPRTISPTTRPRGWAMFASYSSRLVIRASTLGSSSSHARTASGRRAYAST